MAQWVKPEYRKGKIDRAGRLLLPWWTGGPNCPSPDNLGELWGIIQNWRTSHALPLNVFQAGLRKRAKKIDPDVIVAQRLKRLSSLLNKLARHPHMKLSQMQDLGGCRAILSNINAVDQLYDVYRGDPLLLPEETSLKCYDYIRRPKTDGYRGIHVVGRYDARKETRADWNGHRIEIQLRSHLQHAFATAVETVTTFTRTPLKFGAGPTGWRRFFSLVGSAFADRENTPLVKGTPRNQHELIAELKERTKELRVFHRLSGWTNVLQSLPIDVTQQPIRWLLLVLDIKKKTIDVTAYYDSKVASEELAQLERPAGGDTDAVLVWVPSIKQLRTAYPNYYADTEEFLTQLKMVLDGKIG